MENIVFHPRFFDMLIFVAGSEFEYLPKKY